jgi:putative tricarboxylic transport membrane protein
VSGVEHLFLGFQIAITPVNLLVAVIGIVLGTIIGVLPGLGGANGVALLLPLTFTMHPTTAIILLTCIYWGALFGGAITSILFNIPGEPWSVATTLDGYPLAKQGRGGHALTAAFTSSFVGAAFAIVLVSFFAQPLAELALRFGPPEFFAIQLLTFSSFIGLGGGNPMKSLVSILLGFILAAVGLDTITGKLRLTFGSIELMRGFSFIVAVIGLFGLGEIFLTVEEGLEFRGVTPRVRFRDMLATWRELGAYWKTFLRSALIGFWMGFKPGGATPASFMSYGFARRFSRQREKFGTGVLEGVVAPETAAHAAGVAAMLPMITLGIPGSPTAAVMLGGLLIWGLQPGPMLFVEKPDFVWGLIASMYTGNVIGVLMVLFFVPAFAAILRIPFAILTPLIVFVCAIGAYAVNNSMVDVWYMVAFGVIGYVFKKLDYPLAPLVLALVLGDLAEGALRQSLIMSQGSLLIFFESPIAAVITLGAMLLFLLPLLSPVFRRLRGGPTPTAVASPGSH